MATFEGKERRRVRRYPAVELRASLRRKKGLIGNQWVEVHASDFSHLGACIDVDFELAAGDSVTLQFDFKMEVGPIVIDKVPGSVRHVKNLGNLRRCGVQFDDRLDAKVRDQLKRVESLLARSLSVADRIQKRG